MHNPAQCHVQCHVYNVWRSWVSGTTERRRNSLEWLIGSFLIGTLSLTEQTSINDWRVKNLTDQIRNKLRLKQSNFACCSLSLCCVQIRYHLKICCMLLRHMHADQVLRIHAKNLHFSKSIRPVYTDLNIGLVSSCATPLVQLLAPWQQCHISNRQMPYLSCQDRNRFESCKPASKRQQAVHYTQLKSCRAALQR